MSDSNIVDVPRPAIEPRNFPKILREIANSKLRCPDNDDSKDLNDLATYLEHSGAPAAEVSKEADGAY